MKSSLSHTHNVRVGIFNETLAFTQTYIDIFLLFLLPFDCAMRAAF